MSTSHRICETCVYCSFAGNCDRYDKPLTSIEQPACDAYEIHPLLAENAKLRELAERAWKSAERLCQAFDGPCRDDGVTIAEPCPMGERDEECVYGQLQRELRELGVEVDA